ncbi:MAG TPA: protein jag [Dehalococcoidia bacterium]|nr:protein jag [Dehalococcoidia bacterium]
MKEVEVSAKTVDEAIQMALEQLGVDEDQVEVVVLRKGKSGVLGVGAEEARIKVRLLPQLQEKDDVAKVAMEILETLVKSMGIVAEIRATQASAGELPVTLNIEGDDLGILIGRRGQTLASLQYIVRLIVAEKLKMWVPINVDVVGYKKRRYESLRSLALRLAEQVKTRRRPITLEPMPADERRIIHLALSDHPDVSTQSMGEGEARKVAILLKKR